MPYADPEMKRVSDAAYGRAHRANNREAQKRHRERHPGKGAEYSAKWKYGITAEEYDRLFEAQGGLCAICGLVEATKDRMGRVRTRLSIDHDHDSNVVRGLLCHHCNTALGHAKDDPALLRRMASYLEGAS